MTVKEFADGMDARGKDIFATVLMKHENLTMNSPLDTDTAMMLAREFGAALGAALGRSFWGGSSDSRAGGVREPKRHGPSGRLSTAAVPEPDDDRQGINAVGSPDAPASQPRATTFMR
jgi:hypothetical protein